MASRRPSRPPKNGEPPLDWAPTQAVDEPILNGPYEEPSEHWVYRDGVPFKMSGRRPASYWFKTKKLAAGQQQMFAEQERDELDLVNRLRKDVKRWREAGYRGASAVTRDLFAYWFDAARPRRLFFCQREAVETVVYLLEIGLPKRLSATGYKTFEVDAATIDKLVTGERPAFVPADAEQWPRLVDAPADGGLLPLVRLGCKMATGSGKTIVMAMIIAWAFCNRGRNPASTQYPNGVVVCAPNLTVKKRLDVLKPESPQNFYDQFDLIPNKYRELMGGGRVLVTNWHAFGLKSEHSEGGTSYRVVQKGDETPDAFTKDRLGDLASRLPILVLNDEGHHCWRAAPGAKDIDKKGMTAEQTAALEEEADEARVWLAGLDRFNNCGLLGKEHRGVLATIDLSATPFYLSNSGYPEGSPFPWLVSDFGLVDAIESGIVKIPRLPVRDDAKTTDEVGRPDPKFFRLWRHIQDNLSAADKIGKKAKPEAILREAESALATLASQWKLRFEKIHESTLGERPIPPVTVVVCDNTDVAEVVYRRISGERTETVLNEQGKAVEKVVYDTGAALFPELANDERVRHTIRIDTKLLKKIETDEGESKDEAAKALRDLIDTVGKRGMSGEYVRCVVSVSMLTEGWDANNVTHILGVRAFDSQLLCEQVVGRGLRRMSYDVNPATKRLDAEYVDVYGIPFSLIPFKGQAKSEKPDDAPQHRIFAVEEKAQYRIDMPVVEGYTYDIRSSGIRCDVDKLEGLVVNAEPTAVYLQCARGYEEDGAHVAQTEFIKQTRDEFHAATRFQQVIFRLAQLITDDLVAGATGKVAEELKKNLLARHTLYPDIVRILNEYIAKRVTFAKNVDKRELALERYAILVRERVRAGILPAAACENAPLLPIVNSYHPVASTAGVDETTRRPIRTLGKSHLNAAILMSSWEAQAIDVLEDMDAVEAFAPNSRKIGFQIPWEYMGNPRRYEPDFIVRMQGGVHVLLEIKGGLGRVHGEDEVLAKNAAAKKWVEAVNNARRYGQWAFVICEDVAKLRTRLEAHAQQAVVLPFRKVSPKASDQYKTCVPLISLRAAAGAWSEEQTSIEEFGDADLEWASWDAKRKFAKGMFVARVRGKSMEPTIPDGSYVLFRTAPLPSSPERPVLVRYAGAADPETGGQYTVKLYREEATPSGERRVVLRPANPTFAPLILTASDEGGVRVIAELVEVLGPGSVSREEAEA